MKALPASGLPDPDEAADLADFIGLLERLRVWGGDPSFRVLANRVGQLLRPPQPVSKSTIADMFQPGRRRLNQDLVVAVVRALGLDERTVDQWRAACVRVHAGAKAGGPSGVFRQLPADLATFTGRDEELARLLDLASGRGEEAGVRTVVVTAIEGMGGVGKTQLAVHAAHELVRSGHFAEIQLYVNLRGFDPEQPPADPAVVLDAFLRQLEVPAQQIPAGLDERAAMFRDRLHGRDALILLDNAADEDQVRDLIPATPGCLVLMTSRRTLAGLDGVRTCQLDVFSQVEAVRLLARIAGTERVNAEPEAADRIVRHCDRLPLALALAAARLRSRPAWSLGKLADQLRDSRLEAIRAGGRALRPVFDLSYRDLAEPLRRIFRLLGHHPGPDVTPAMVGALSGVPESEAEDALESLQDVNLIRQSTPGRYELHDLLRLLAVELAEEEPEPEPDAPLARLAAWAVATGYAAAVAINTPQLDRVAPGVQGESIRFDSYDDGLAWFDQEQQNLAAVQQSAARSGLHRHVWQLALVQKQFFVVRRHLVEFLAAQQLAVTAAEACGDQAALALMLSGLGASHWMSDRLDEAEDCYLKARRVYRSIGDHTGEGSALVDYGAVRVNRGEHEHAVAIFTRALDLLRNQESLRPRATSLMNRGVLHAWLGRGAEAITDSREALAIFRQLDDRRSQALAIGNLAEFHQQDGDLTTAFDLYREQQELGRSLGDTFLQADALLGTGETHAAAGHTEQARQAWLEALRLYEKINHPRAADARQRLDANHNTQR